jgi:hypothetical protein
MAIEPSELEKRLASAFVSAILDGHAPEDIANTALSIAIGGLADGILPPPMALSRPFRWRPTTKKTSTRPDSVAGLRGFEPPDGVCPSD